MPKAEILRTERIRQKWENPTPTVVPGLAPSIATMLARAASGMPRTVATRTIESYYRNQDLTDIADLANNYKALKENVEKKTAALAEMKKQAELQAKNERERILNYLNSQPISPNP